MTTRRHPGIVERHSKSCPTRDGGRCVKPCQPRFEAWVWSARDGRKVRKSFPTPAAARGWRTDALAALRRGTMRAPTSTTLNAAAAAFVAGIESGVIVSRNGSPYKPSVRRAYARDLRLFVLPEVGAVKLAELRRADMQALVDRLHAAGMSPTRLKGIVMPVRALCRHALERDELVVNPTEHLRLPAVTGKRERAASPAEAERLLSALADDDRALWATAFYAGLRRGELRALRWSDIDLTENVISVERSWDDVEGAIDPKSEKGRRRVPIATPLRLLLLEHKARTGRRAGEFVFGSTSTRPFTSTNIRRRARMAWAATAIGEFFCGRDAQLEPIGLHECRHTYVSLMAAAGFALEEIGDYVGHSSTYMVDRYRHLIEGHEARAAARFDAYLATGAV